MDIVLVNAAALGLPTSRRAGAIVYDGTRDLDLWPPPGPDRDLLQAYGPSLESVLTRERGQLPGRSLARAQALRVSPGKLHCDYLIWVGAREPHGDDEQAPACALDALGAVARAALELADKHHTSRVAFGVLGGGPGAADPSERLAALVRGASAFRDACKQAGRVPAIEEVLVCSPSAAEIAKARRATERLTRQASLPPPVRSAATSSRASAPRATRSRSTSSASSTRSPSSSSTAPGGARKPRGNHLDRTELEAARTRALPYDRARTYSEGDWVMHPKFGVGRVQSVLVVEAMVMVLFEDGEQRRLLHAGR